jgi:nitric oxide reductase activation protein
VSRYTRSSRDNRQPNVKPAVVAAIRAAFDAARVGKRGWEYRTREGRLDTRNVWRNDATGTRDIFKFRDFPSPPALNVHVLVDASGSMHAYDGHTDERGHGLTRWESAQDLSATLVESFSRVSSVTMNVWQFSTHGYTTRLNNVFRPGRNWLHKMGANVGGGNADAFALRAVGNRAIETSRPDERPVVIVISDGAPTDTGRNSQEGSGHLALVGHSQQVTADLRAKGAIVMAVSIVGDKSLSTAMYGAEGTIEFDGDWNHLGVEFGRIFGRNLAPR